MHVLPITLNHDGFVFRQVTRVGKIAIYSQWRGPLLIGYEVVVAQWRKAHTWPSGRSGEAGEFYPSSSQWGLAGWTFKSLAAAEAHLTTLQETTSVQWLSE